MSEVDEVKGLTLDVYLYVVNKRKPVGPRDVTKGVNLSSPSVAYRHLQKLEDLGYLAKNEFGEYWVAKKAVVKGQIWIGHYLIPKMWLYAIVFVLILLVELIIFVIHFSFENYEFKVFFSLLMIITGLALGVFLIEGLLQSRRKNFTSST